MKQGLRGPHGNQNWLLENMIGFWRQSGTWTYHKKGMHRQTYSKMKVSRVQHPSLMTFASKEA